MSMSQGTASERFGAELRRLRVHAGFSQQKIQEETLISQSKVSDLELGKVRPKRDEAEALDALLTKDGSLIVIWDNLFRSYEPPEWYRKLPLLEQRAIEIQEYQPLLVPGLVQTEDYARASITASNRRLPLDVVEGKVRERLDRQSILSRPDAPYLSIVLDESALRRRLGDPATMEGQIERLREVASNSRSEVLVVPADTRQHPGLDGGFKLLRTPEGKVLLYQETRAGGGVVPEAEPIEDHVSLMAELRGAALPAEQSSDLLAKIQGEWK